jgi:hypothetical protein
VRGSSFLRVEERTLIESSFTCGGVALNRLREITITTTTSN